MKNNIVILLLCLVFSISNFAQEIGIQSSNNQEPTMAVKISPLQLLAFSLDGKFTVAVHDRVAISVPLVVSYVPKKILKGIDDIHYYSAGIGAQIFLSNKAQRSGFHIEPSIAVGYGQFTPESMASFNSTFLRATTIVGYGWFFDNGLNLNLGLGAFYNYAFSEEATPLKKTLSLIKLPSAVLFTNSYGLTRGFGPTAEISLGYAW